MPDHDLAIALLLKRQVKDLPTRKERRIALQKSRENLVKLTEDKKALDLGKFMYSKTDEDIKNLAQALKGNTVTTTLNLENNEKITKKVLPFF